MRVRKIVPVNFFREKVWVRNLSHGGSTTGEGPVEGGGLWSPGLEGVRVRKILPVNFLAMNLAIVL